MAFAIINELCSTGEYIQALQLLSPIVKEYPNDWVLSSSLARIFLQMGNIVGAEAIFNKIEQYILDQYPENSEMSDTKKQAYIIMHTNRGFKALSKGDFGDIIIHFQKVLEIDPLNPTATNNLALGWLYNGKLQLAIKQLEEFLSSDYNTNLRYEPTVLNLCTLYDLACHDSQQKKRQLLTAAARFLPDNFDLSSFKLPDLSITINPTLN